MVKNLTDNAGDVREADSIPWSVRYPGEGHGNPLQYSWASLVPYLVKNLPAVWETWVQSLGWEDPLDMAVSKSDCLRQAQDEDQRPSRCCSNCTHEPMRDKPGNIFSCQTTRATLVSDPEPTVT